MFDHLPASEPESTGPDTPLRAMVADDGVIRIEVGTSVLIKAVALSEWANPFDETVNDFRRTFAIEDRVGFARDVVRELVREAENGESPLARLIDEACEAAVNNGSIGILDSEVALPFGQFHACEVPK